MLLVLTSPCLDALQVLGAGTSRAQASMASCDEHAGWQGQALYQVRHELALTRLCILMLNSTTSNIITFLCTRLQQRGWDPLRSHAGLPSCLHMHNGLTP